MNEPPTTKIGLSERLRASGAPLTDPDLNDEAADELDRLAYQLSAAQDAADLWDAERMRLEKELAAVREAFVHDIEIAGQGRMKAEQYVDAAIAALAAGRGES